MKQAKHRIVTLIVILIIVFTALLLTNFSPLGNTNVAGMAAMSVTGMTTGTVLEGGALGGFTVERVEVGDKLKFDFDTLTVSKVEERDGNTILYYVDSEGNEKQIASHPSDTSIDTLGVRSIERPPEDSTLPTTTSSGGGPAVTTPTPSTTSSITVVDPSTISGFGVDSSGAITFPTNTDPKTYPAGTQVAKLPGGSYAISQDGTHWIQPINGGTDSFIINPTTGKATGLNTPEGTVMFSEEKDISEFDSYSSGTGTRIKTEDIITEDFALPIGAGAGTGDPTPTTTAEVSAHRQKLYKDLGLDPTQHQDTINQINALIEGGAFVGGNDEVLRVLGGGNINQLGGLINEMNVINEFTTPDYSVTMGGNVIATGCGSYGAGCTTVDDNHAVGYPNPDGSGNVVYVTQDKKWYQGQGKAKYYYYDPVTGERKSYDPDLINTEDYSPESKQDLRQAENEFKEDLPEMDFDGDGEEDGKQLSILQESQYFQTYNQIHSANMNQLVGYLNGALTKKLGPKLAEVPSRFCRDMLHVGDFPEDSWLNIPHNTTPAGLQYALTKGIRTVNIDGEKEEITPEMFRYAFTIRILADQYVAWETYLYNSCTEEDSKEIFYDYGSVSMGEYFMYHYAGSSGEDMIFEYGTDPVYIFDTACVKVADEEGEEVFCTPLTNGNGFITPTMGTDYGCYVATGAAEVYY